jgi:hypothetical protein
MPHPMSDLSASEFKYRWLELLMLVEMWKSHRGEFAHETHPTVGKVHLLFPGPTCLWVDRFDITTSGGVHVVLARNEGQSFYQGDGLFSRASKAVRIPGDAWTCGKVGTMLMVVAG